METPACQPNALILVLLAGIVFLKSKRKSNVTQIHRITLRKVLQNAAVAGLKAKVVLKLVVIRENGCKAFCILAITRLEVSVDQKR